MFPTLDSPVEKDVVGHWVVVSLNLKAGRFEYLDSLHEYNATGGWYIFQTMIKNITRLWKILNQDKRHNPPLRPFTLEGLPTDYLVCPKQDNKLVLFPISYIFFAT